MRKLKIFIHTQNVILTKLSADRLGDSNSGEIDCQSHQRELMRLCPITAATNINQQRNIQGRHLLHDVSNRLTTAIH